MCYSPVRHSLIAQRVRLACVRHAASVYPEPGSNSPYIMFRTHSREVCSEDVERSQPNIISGCFTQIDRNCFCKQLLFCFPLFNCQGTTSKALLDSTARNKCYRFSFKDGEEYIFYLPTGEGLGASSCILSGVSLQEKEMASLPRIIPMSLIITKRKFFLFHLGRGFHFPSIPSSTH